MADHDNLKDVILSATEECLAAQLRAVRKLRKGGATPAPKVKSGRSQTDMAYDILKKARQPLRATELIERIEAAFGVKVDRESLVSALTKRVARKDRFVRTGRNTFSLARRE